MSQAETEPVKILVTFSDEALTDFNLVKKHLRLTANTDVLRQGVHHLADTIRALYIRTPAHALTDERAPYHVEPFDGIHEEPA